MIAGHCARSDSSQFLLPFRGSVLQNTDHVACQYAHSVLYWSLAHSCRENQNDCIILLTAQAQCTEHLKWPFRYQCLGIPSYSFRLEVSPTLSITEHVSSSSIRHVVTCVPNYTASYRKTQGNFVTLLSENHTSAIILSHLPTCLQTACCVNVDICPRVASYFVKSLLHCCLVSVLSHM